MGPRKQGPAALIRLLAGDAAGGAGAGLDPFLIERVGAIDAVGRPAEGGRLDGGLHGGDGLAALALLMALGEIGVIAHAPPALPAASMASAAWPMIRAAALVRPSETDMP